MKEMTPLEEIRHSAAHVLATAVLRLYPDTQLDIGPPTESGFYYDFDSEIPFTPEVLEAIEAEMKKVIKENQKFEKIEVSREEATRMIKEMGQETYKLGRLDDIPEDEEISFYRNGEFSDLSPEHMFPTPRKSRPSSSFKLPVRITAEIRQTSNSSAFTERPSPPRTN